MKKENKNRNTSGVKKTGRKVATWQIVLISIFAFIIFVLCLSAIFVGNWEGIFGSPEVDSGKDFNVPPIVDDKPNDPNKDVIENDNIVKRTDGEYNFLVIGKDDAGLNTDVVMIVNFGSEDGHVNLIQIPRDTYVEYDGTPHKINSALGYYYGKARRAGKSNLYSCALSDFSDLLEKLFYIEIDEYAMVNLDAFKNIVDIIGGVPMDVPYDMHYDDPFQDLSIHINKGYQVLDGEKSEGFVRFRSGYLNADIGRGDAQKMFMTAFFKQIKAKAAQNIVPIVEQVMKNMTTDVSVTDAVTYAKKALSLDLANINMVTLPGEGLNANGVSYYVMHRHEAREVINNYFNVYNREITDDLFDADRMCTDENGSINRIYEKEGGSYVINTGDDIDQSGITIPLIRPRPQQSSSYSTAVNTQTVTETVTTEIETEIAVDTLNVETADSEETIEADTTLEENTSSVESDSVVDTIITEDITAETETTAEEVKVISPESETEEISEFTESVSEAFEV